MEDKYHPEFEDSSFCDGEKASIFRSIIGSLNCIITLGRFDVQKATNSLSRFNMAPREGHFTKAVRILGYLKSFQRGQSLLTTITQTTPSTRQIWNMIRQSFIQMLKKRYHMIC